VVVVNETFAREFFPGVEDPVGRRIRSSGDSDADGWYRIVGLARDVRHYGLEEPARPGLYFPLEDDPPTTMALVLSAAVPPSSLVAPSRAVLRELDPELPLFDVGTPREALERSLAVRRAYSGLIGGFAAMALVLALGGIYGVLSYLVGQRLREIGIRVALGATRRRIVAMVLRQGMALAAAGLALGFAAALAGGGLLGSLLLGVSARDPVTFAAVGALLGSTALLASLVPARRGLGVDPQVVLREE
jgi:putative ABC transport system permease protein